MIAGKKVSSIGKPTNPAVAPTTVIRPRPLNKPAITQNPIQARTATNNVVVTKTIKGEYRISSRLAEFALAAVPLDRHVRGDFGQQANSKQTLPHRLD